jgi:integrase
VTTGSKFKAEAERIEMAILTACGSGDYRSLDPASRATCIRLFRNQKWGILPGLLLNEPAREELTLWKAIEMCLRYPDVRNSNNRERHEQAFVHLVEKWGKDFPVKSIWIPQIKNYQDERLSEGAAAATVNKEKAALSKMFHVLMELRQVEVNPAKLVKNLSEKSGEREVYIGFSDFQAILELLPRWVRPIVQTAHHAGMRRGEVLGLVRERVNLDKRIMMFRPEKVKEGKWKRVPIHKDLLPVLEGAMKVRSISSDKVFLLDGCPPNEDSIRKPWVKAVRQVLGIDPLPRFHDLRATWKTNAMRSDMDYEIRERMLGHWNRHMTVAERYGRISDDDLVRAIDRMTFDHGETEILVSTRKEKSDSRDSGPLSEILGTNWEQSATRRLC